MSITNFHEAKSFIENCRDIHQEWIDYLTKYPETKEEHEPVVNIAGDIEHHTELVNKYNDVIKLIETKFIEVV